MSDLRYYTVDYDGSEMHDSAEPKYGVTCRMLRDASDIADAAGRVIDAFETLGKTRSIDDQIRLHRECESSLVALKKALEA